MTDETQANQAQTAATSAAKPTEQPFGPIDEHLADQTPAQKAAAIAAKKADLQRQLDELNPKPPTLQEMSTDQLHVHFFDKLVAILGAHPVLEEIWKELRARIETEATSASTTAK